MLPTGPDISVIIPSYNSEEWVGAAIDSVLQQRVAGIEIVAVDDGSADGTLAVLKSFGQKIRIIEKPNGGVVSARRAGATAARGKYIKFLDSDDVVPAGGICLLLNAIDRFPGCAFIGRSVEVSVNGAVLGEKMYGIGYMPAHLSEVKKEYLLTQATSSSLWLIPKELFIVHDLLGDSGIQLGEEYAFCMRIIRSHCSIRFIDRVVVAVRIHDSPARLSKSTDESRHLKQADLIAEAVIFLRLELPSHDFGALKQIAALCWARGRDCLRMGNYIAAKRYFELAVVADKSIEPVGSRSYRAACNVLGPIWAEMLSESVKKFNRR